MLRVIKDALVYGVLGAMPLRGKWLRYALLFLSVVGLLGLMVVGDVRNGVRVDVFLPLLAGCALGGLALLLPGLRLLYKSFALAKNREHPDPDERGIFDRRATLVNLEAALYGVAGSCLWIAGACGMMLAGVTLLLLLGWACIPDAHP